jgi:formylglycine-generating enzyme required for sulfatase activity
VPRTIDLPADLEPLARRNKIDLDFTRFDTDIARLVSSLRYILAPAAGGLSPKTVGITAAAGAVVLGAVWLGTRTPSPVPVALVAAASAASSAVPVEQPAAASATLPPLIGKEPPPAVLTVEPKNVPVKVNPNGLDVLDALKVEPKAPPKAQPRSLAVGQRFRYCDDYSCPWMVVLPAGSFMMGAPESEPGREENEGPQHRVQVASFAIGQYEVTFRQWDACVAAGGCKTKPGDAGWGRGQRPVINVSWDDAQQYVKWLSGKTGQTYRLPSEAEWEYAARAGTTTPFAFGERITTAQANVGGSKTLPVGSFAKNAWDLYDLYGNVEEWVQDCWHGSYQGAPADGRAWVSNCAEDRRLLRGGGWRSGPLFAHSADRFRVEPALRNFNIGFRLARMLP